MASESEQPVRRRTALPALAALAGSSVLFYLGTGMAPIAALAWLAPLPVLLLAPRASARQAAGVAFLAYLLGTANNWVYYFEPRPSAAIPLPMAVSITVGAALVFTLAVMLFRALIRQGRALLAAFAAPAAWTGAVFLTSFTLGGLDTATLSTTQYDVPVVLQLASVTGSWGVEFLVVLVPAAIAALLAPGVGSAARWRTGLATALFVGISLVYGVVRLAGADDSQPAQQVAVLAPGQGHWATDITTAEGSALLSSYVDAVAALPGDPRLVVLPEAAFAADRSSLPALVEPLARVARTRQAAIVVGLVLREQQSVLNAALIVPVDGEPLVYTKHYTSLGGAGGQFRPGSELAFVPGSTIRAGVQICQDLNFTALSRDYAAGGAQLVVAPAADEEIDGWWHGRMALMRGVEHGFAVAWSAQRGAPMISDGWGRVLAETRTGGAQPFTEAVTDVPTGPGPTLYTRLGNWFPWLCLVVALGALLLATLRNPSHEPSRSRAKASDQVEGPREASSSVL